MSAVPSPMEALERVRVAVAADTFDPVPLLRRLVDLDTPSSDVAALERLYAVYGEQLEARGFAVRRVDGADGVPVLVAERGSGPRIGMVGHADTVFPAGEVTQRPFTEDDRGRAYGPGVADMKGGLVAMLRVVDVLDAAGVELAWRLLVNGDEELGSPTSREILVEELADRALVLVFEPGRPGGEFVSHRRGTLRFRLAVAGVAAHSGVAPRDGVNAIHDIATRIGRIAAIAADYPDCDVNATMLDGGSGLNTVPDAATCAFDIRTTTLAEDDAIRQAVAEIAAADGVPGASCSVEWLASRPPLELTDALAPVIGAFEAAGETLDADVRFVGTGGGSDGNLLAAAGILVADACGPVGGGYHRRDEFIDLASLGTRAAVCAGAIAVLTSRGQINNDASGAHA